jgi:hypothetical protein
MDPPFTAKLTSEIDFSVRADTYREQLASIYCPTDTNLAISLSSKSAE